jgi:translation initiation factor IF-3
MSWVCYVIAWASLGTLATVGAFNYCSFGYQDMCFSPDLAHQRLHIRISSRKPFEIGYDRGCVSGLSNHLTILSQWRGGSGGGVRRGGAGGRDSRRDIAPKGPPMNKAITAPSVRVVASGPDGKDEMLGIMSREEALSIAEDRVRLLF